MEELIKQIIAAAAITGFIAFLWTSFGKLIDHHGRRAKKETPDLTPEAGPELKYFDPVSIKRTIIEKEFSSWEELQIELDKDYPDDLIMNVFHVEVKDNKIKAVMLVGKLEKMKV